VAGFDLGQASKEEAVEKVRYQPEASVRLYPKRQKKGRIQRPFFYARSANMTASRIAEN
jgi:hypothetical protein